MEPEPRVKHLSVAYTQLPTLELLDTLLNVEYPGRIALVSSFGTEAAVLLHLVSRVSKRIPIIFLDTGKLFGETRRYKERLIQSLGLEAVEPVPPDSDSLAREDPHGRLWLDDPDRCCHIRKTVPLAKALAPYDAWISGRKRFQNGSRADLPLFEASGEQVKVNPLRDWSRADILSYFTVHGLPQHPLERHGYLSIGCMPCSRPVRSGEGLRDGRWAGQSKTECGIHLAPLSAAASRGS